MTEHETKMKRFITIKLRKASLHWDARTLAKRAARVDRGLYKCAICKEHFAKIELDHIKPVIDLKNDKLTFDEWLVMFARGLLCTSDNWSVVCVPCHSAKTLIESHVRTLNRQKKKTRKRGKKR